MMIPFKFFVGKIYTDEFEFPRVRRVARGEEHIPVGYVNVPPYGISRRHWNMLPQDLRGGEREDMETYIEGWEAARHGNYNNPHPDQIRGEVWNRGFRALWERRNGGGQNYTDVI